LLAVIIGDRISIIYRWQALAIFSGNGARSRQRLAKLPRYKSYNGIVPEAKAAPQDVSIRFATLSDKEQLARLCEALWPETKAEHHATHLARILDRPSVLRFPATFIVAETGDRTLAGFLEVGLRSHADGCDNSQAVGYIEGWFVADGHRREGIGKRLLAAAEDWARSQGCVEMASDALIDNQLSQSVHESLGYSVVDRCVHYCKPLYDERTYCFAEP
jgi:aminoglycoside 6'-N-acetyltransferase I